MLVRVQGKRDIYLCFGVYSLAQPLQKSSQRFPKKIKLKLPHYLAIQFLDICPKDSPPTHGLQYNHVDFCSVYNVQDMESAQVVINRDIEIKILYIHSVILVRYHEKLKCEMYRKIVGYSNCYVSYGRKGSVWQHRLKEMNTICFLS